jgi:hypothetical protein
MIKKRYKNQSIKDLCPFCHSVNYINRTQTRKRCFECGKGYYTGKDQYKNKDKIISKYKDKLEEVKDLNLPKDIMRFED